VVFKLFISIEIINNRYGLGDSTKTKKGLKRFVLSLLLVHLLLEERGIPP
jgi:hypothetical protein